VCDAAITAAAIGRLEATEAAAVGKQAATEAAAVVGVPAAAMPEIAAAVGVPAAETPEAEPAAAVPEPAATVGVPAAAMSEAEPASPVGVPAAVVPEAEPEKFGLPSSPVGWMVPEAEPEKVGLPSSPVGWTTVLSSAITVLAHDAGAEGIRDMDKKAKKTKDQSERAAASDVATGNVDSYADGGGQTVDRATPRSVDDWWADLYGNDTNRCGHGYLPPVKTTMTKQDKVPFVVKTTKMYEVPLDAFGTSAMIKKKKLCSYLLLVE
jgi:hypothetical protein